MTARKKSVRRSQVRRPKLQLTARRTTTTRIQVTKDGEIVIEDALLCELVKRWESEKRVIKYKVICPPSSGGGGRADEGPPEDLDSTNTNCPCKP